MAKQLSKTGITRNNTIEAWHVTQSIDALTGTDDYDITISGSLNLTGSLTVRDNHVDNPRGVKISGSNSIDGDTRDNQITFNRSLQLHSSGTSNMGILLTHDEIISGSAASTASFGTYIGDGSQLTGLVSASYALTASYASTASYAVSASHEIIKEVSSSHADTADTAAGLTGQPSIYVTNITASGKISASGNIYGNDFYVGGSQFTDISSVPNHFGIGFAGLGSLALQNITSSGTIKSTQLYINSGSANSVLSPQSQDAALIIMSSSGAYSTTSNLTPNNLVLSSEYYTSDAGTINDKAATSLLFVTTHGTTSQKNATAQIACVAKNSANHESYITFNTRNSSGNIGERFRIEYGQTSVIGSLDVSGNITSVGNISSSGDIYATDLELDDPTEATINMYQAGVQNIKITSRGNQATYFNAGKVAIGTDTPSSEQLTVSGSISSSGTITAVSMSGDGSGLTNVIGEWDGTHNGNAEITGSLIITNRISSPDAMVRIGTNSAGNNSGTYNTYVGNEAGYEGNSSCYWNVAVGNLSQKGGTGNSGDNNTSIGNSSLYKIDGGSQNTALGYGSLYNITSGDDNIGIGHRAGYNQTTGDGNITIGSGSLGVAGESNQLRIGNGNDLVTISASLATGDIIFPSTASAAYFVGDGSQLTNLPAGTTPSLQQVTTAGNITDQGLTVSGSTIFKPSTTTAASIEFSTEAYSGQTNPTITLKNATGGKTLHIGHSVNDGLLELYNSTGIKVVNIQEHFQAFSPINGIASGYGTYFGVSSSIDPSVASSDSYVKIVNHSYSAVPYTHLQLNKKGTLAGSGSISLYGISSTYDTSAPAFNITSDDGTPVVNLGGPGFVHHNGKQNNYLKYGLQIGGDFTGTTTSMALTDGSLIISGSTGGFSVKSVSSKAEIKTNDGATTLTLGTTSSFTAISASSYISASSFIGDGSQLTNLPASSTFPFTGDAVITGSLIISASATSQSLSVIGSGSTVFDVIGSVGTLFSVDDDLTGTLFTANDISGFPVLEVSASGETYIGKSPQSLYTTAVISATSASNSQSLCTLSTSSYDGAFFDFTCISASNTTVGSIMSTWNGGTVSYNEYNTSSIGATYRTAGLDLQVIISQSQAQLVAITDSTSPNTWKVKTIIKAI
jgi:hypothetical protein